MKNFIIRSLVVGLLTFSIVFFLDPSFVKYEIENTGQSQSHYLSFAADLDQDGYTDFVSNQNIAGTGMYMEIWTKGRLARVWRDTSYLINQKSCIADLDDDGNLESYFFSRANDSCFLNILEFSKFDDGIEIDREILFFTKFKDKEEDTKVRHISVEDLNGDGEIEILISLSKGLTNRELALYYPGSKKFKFADTKVMDIRNIEVIDIDTDGRKEIYFSTYANGNLRPEYIPEFSSYYNIYQSKFYTDLNAYWGVMDCDLNITQIHEKEGFTSMFRTAYIENNGTYFFYVLETNLMDSLSFPIITKFDEDGKKLAQISIQRPLDISLQSKNSGNMIDVYEKDGVPKIFVVGMCDSILVFDQDLRELEYLYFEGFHSGTRIASFDLDEDGTNEYYANTLLGGMIFRNQFLDPIIYYNSSAGRLQEVFPVVSNNEKTGLLLKTNNRHPIVKYGLNEYYWLKYILYLGMFFVIYFLIYFLQKMSAAQLEKENKKLELTVMDRTKEIQLKNEDLEKAIDLISQQKVILEEKNHEILDSINYAKRIQSAILPPEKLIRSYLPDSFVLFKPKDIVAGDFYWLEHLNGKILFAAADCTGHGVPGAMVSVICNNGLNRSVREYGISDPGKILDKTREIIIQEFEKSEFEVKDGMDIALCCLDANNLQYAGANNPLWIIRNKVLIEFKPDKQPIGKFDFGVNFTTTTIPLLKGDTIYIFSDGFVDQFGGEKGKKFKAKALREMLIQVHELDMNAQKNAIDEIFENWRGTLEQIDDVCMIGVRV